MKIVIVIATFFITYFIIETPILKAMFKMNIGTIFTAHGVVLLISALAAFLAYKLSFKEKGEDKSVKE